MTATNSQLEAFIYSVAHDLRAPLRAMQGFSSMLVEEAGEALSKTGQNYARRINKSAQFMDAMLIDMLALSRISARGTSPKGNCVNRICSGRTCTARSAGFQPAVSRISNPQALPGAKACRAGGRPHSSLETCPTPNRFRSPAAAMKR